MRMADRIRAALLNIDPTDRENWVKAGMAIKSELGDAGFALWDQWSQGAENYNNRAARDVWRSIKPGGGIKIGTLHHMARGNGWRDDGPSAPTREEITDRADEAKIERERADTRAKAAEVLNAATEASADHPYLARKQVAPVATLHEIEASEAGRILGYTPKSSGEPLTGRLLVVPVTQGDGISTLELIDGDGRKTALAGRGTKAGGYWATGPLPEGEAVLLGEGVATVLSASEATGRPGIAALSSGNLGKVAEAMMKRYKVTVLADLLKDTGEPDKHAVEAARAVGGKLAVPDFGDQRKPGQTDFNDMKIQHGGDAVARAIEGATVPIAIAPAGDSGGWPEPQPLTAKIEPEPYPLDALPDTLRAAVEEVAGFVQAPSALVASSALAALSLASQAHIDAKREEKLHGPVGLFLLTIADSGERKSTCDGFFTKAISDYEEAKAEEAKPILKDYKAAIEAWEAKRGGIKEKIRQLAKDQKPTASMETALRDLEHDKPEPPRIPRLLYVDATPEALAYGLAKQWPSGGVVSAEAGIVFGSHGMGKDSVMRNLGLLNQLWDGKSLTIDRRTSESFTVRGARLTVALQIQDPTLREFFARSGQLARGTGFLARFLVAWPESTQGRRQFTEAPASWPHLAAFNRRIAEILNQPAPISEDGALTPAMLSLAPDAKTAWVEYHNAIERELGSGGEYYDVRDVASKSADNAARLAALFHLFERGTRGAIGPDSFERASLITAWHLHEARRFFGEIALPVELADAVRLDEWLIKYCQRERTHIVPTREAQRLGPVREKEKLKAALRELEELDRLRVVQEGKQKTIKVNPRLLGVKP